MSCSTGFRGRSRAIPVHVAGSCYRGLPLDGLRCRGRLLSCPCCCPSSFPVVRLCCCLKRTARPIGRDSILSPVGLTCFLLSDGDEGQGTALLLTPPACARTRRDYAWKENGFALASRIASGRRLSALWLCSLTTATPRTAYSTAVVNGSYPTAYRIQEHSSNGTLSQAKAHSL